MERTQIYLTRDQTAALDREAKRAGTTRSHLIREAVGERYGTGHDTSAIEGALLASAGAWTGRRDDGETYVEKLRTGARWSELDAMDNASE